MTHFKRVNLSDFPAIGAELAQAKSDTQKMLSSINSCEVVGVVLATLLTLGALAGGGYLVATNLNNLESAYFIAGGIISVAGATIGTALIRAAIMNARESTAKHKRSERGFSEKTLSMKDMVDRVSNIHEIPQGFMSYFVRGLIQKINNKENTKNLSRCLMLAEEILLSEKASEDDKQLLMHNLNTREKLEALLPRCPSQGSNMDIFKRALNTHRKLFTEIVIANPEYYLGNKHVLELYINKRGNFDEALLKNHGRAIIMAARDSSILWRAIGKRSDLLKDQLTGWKLPSKQRAALATRLQGTPQDTLACLEALRSQDVFNDDPNERMVTRMYMRAMRKHKEDELIAMICKTCEENPAQCTTKNIAFMSQNKVLSRVLEKISKQGFALIANIINENDKLFTSLKRQELIALADGITEHHITLKKPMRRELLVLSFNKKIQLPHNPMEDMRLVEKMADLFPEVFMNHFNAHRNYRTPEMVRRVLPLLDRILAMPELSASAFDDIVKAAVSLNDLSILRAIARHDYRSELLLHMTLQRKIGLLRALPQDSNLALICQLLPNDHKLLGNNFTEIVRRHTRGFAMKFLSLAEFRKDKEIYDALAMNQMLPSIIDLIANPVNLNFLLKEVIDYFVDAPSIDMVRRQALLQISSLRDVSLSNRLRCMVAQGDKHLMDSIKEDSTLTDVLVSYLRKGLYPSTDVFKALAQERDFGEVINNIERRYTGAANGSTRLAFAKKSYSYMSATDQARFPAYAPAKKK